MNRMKELLKDCAIAAGIVAVAEGIVALLSGMSVGEYFGLLAGSLAITAVGGVIFLVFVSHVNEIGRDE